MTAIAIERTLTQTEFDAFAALSGDDNPIHVDAVYAASTPFGRPVAHGVMLYSILRGLADRLRPGWRLIEQDIMFPAPTYAEERLRFSATIQHADDSRARVHVECRAIDADRATCTGFMELTR
jgi:acyl dehydratase